MLCRIRYSSFLLVLSVLLCCGVSSPAQLIRFEDFSDATYANRYLQQNGSATLATYQSQGVLRLTNGSDPSAEASTVYFHDRTHIAGVGKQAVAGGFTTWFAFQVHNPIQCCTPGDGIAFIVQNSSGTDSSYGARGLGITALGAGAGSNQAGALGYAGINNNLTIEFDVVQDAWDPTSNHIAIQTCGPNTNTPVHLPGNYTIGTNDQVTSCLLNQQSIDSKIPALGGTCGDGSCTDGALHNVVIGYTPPMGNQPGQLQIWLDPTFVPGTHAPRGPATMTVPYNIVYDPENNPSGLTLDPVNGGSAWVGFTASQPAGGGATQDVFGWEFTLHSPSQIQQIIQPGGTPTVFAFGAHQTTVTYPQGFSNPSGILMTVTSTPTDRQQFYQTRLAGTQFANEQCIVYSGTGGGAGPPTATNGNCLVYSYTCQDTMGNQVTCPSEPQCSGDPTQCIDIDTTFYSSDNVTPTNADYLENDIIGSNNWMSIFTSYQSKPIDGTTSGRGGGFGGTGSSGPSPSKRKFLTGAAGSADIVATFNPSKP